MGKLLTKDKLQQAIGQEIGVSDWFEVIQENVNKFADITFDHQFIHIDEEKATQTFFGGTIAHGFLTLSMLPYFAELGCGVSIEGAKMEINYGCDKVRFLHPVRVGSRIRGRSTLISVEEKKPGQYLFNSEVMVEIENIETPALVAKWLVMIVT